MKRRISKFQQADYAPANLLRRLKQESYKKRRSLMRILVGVIVVAFAINLSMGPFGTLELIRMNQKKRGLQDKIHMLSIDLANLEWQTRQLENPLYIEKLARENFWMHKPGEIIVKIPSNLLQ